jgi:hypothetical protein
MLLGCQPEAPRDATAPSDTTRAPASPETSRVLGVPLSDLVDAVLSGRDTTALNRLGPPDSITTAPQPNRHVPGQMDTLRTYHYDGARLTVYDVSASEDRFITTMQVTSPAYVTQDSLHVGSPWSAVEDALGTPARQGGNEYIYELGEPVAAPNLLRLTVEADTVQQMTWSFYVD